MRIIISGLHYSGQNSPQGQPIFKKVPIKQVIPEIPKIAKQADIVIILGQKGHDDTQTMYREYLQHVPAYHIAAGNPARGVGKRFSDGIIEQLSEIEWWNWSEDRIKRNRQLFEVDLKNAPDQDIRSLVVD